MPSFQDELSELRLTHRFRTPSYSAGINFSSNDYLGLSEDADIREGLIQFLSHNKRLGSTGSRLLTGHSEGIEKLEQFISMIFESENSLVFGSGYLASLGVCAALDSSQTEFFSDSLNHASWIDGLRLARGKRTIISHFDLQAFDRALDASSAPRKVIITESIFSMDGDVAPIAELLELALRHRAYLVVDEAHATGFLGPKGLGGLSELQLSPVDKSVLIAVHSAGKALGAYGAFVCCSNEFKDLMINKSRSQIFSTALSPVMIEHIRLALKKLHEELAPIKILQRNAFHFHSLIERIGISKAGPQSGPQSGQSQIIPIAICGNEQALAAAAALQICGFGVKAIRAPTVAPGAERLRVSLTAQHTLNDLNAFAAALERVVSGENDESIRCGN